MIVNNFIISQIQVQQANFAMLYTVHLKGDNLVQFLIDWDKMMLGLTFLPEDLLLEHIFRMQIEECPPIKREILDYEKAVHRGEQERNK